MEASTVFRGSILRACIYLLASAYVGILLASLLMQRPLSGFFMIFVGYTAAMMIVAVYAYRTDAISIILRGDAVEGPVGAGLFKKRKTVSVNEIVLDTSRLPSTLKAGYLCLSDESRLTLHSPYFSVRRGAEIFEEISKRQQAAGDKMFME